MTNPASNSGGGGREAPAGAKEVDTKDKTTPNTDMQAEDAGTASSGNDSGEGSVGRENDVQGAMKQTSKTSTERGSNGER